MTDDEPLPNEPTYLVFCTEAGWRDVYRLVPGLCLTIGRESTNRVVVQDDRCSRRHAEVFFTNGGWVVRDLGSSNGTHVNNQEITGQTTLQEGDSVQIGSANLVFTHDLTRKLNSQSASIESDTRVKPQDAEATSDDQSEGSSSDDRSDDSACDEPEILERRRRSRFLEKDAADSPVAKEFASLYRLGSTLLAAGSIRELAQTAIDGLMEVLTADLGAVLLLPKPTAEEADVDELRLVVFRAPDDMPYHRVSDRLSHAALTGGDGTLALNVTGEASAGTFQTLEKMKAQSVICAPIRDGKAIYGLIHLYSLTPEHALDADALEFTLAVAEHMARILAKLTEQEQLAKVLARAKGEAKQLRQMLAVESDLIGKSESMRVLKDQIARFASKESTALIRGESGVGKELVARAIHFNSLRRDKPFVCLNCAALTETLLESELFGHEKGAFTGATDRKPGKFEQANGGTIFLDEVGEMSPQIQAKFLRVLEGHSFERVGGHTTVSVDVRVVAATNRDLEQAVRENEFRKDLFFRLNILDIEVPPLRDRRDDVELLVNHFLQLTARQHGGKPKTVHFDAMEILIQYDWPGNVRELRNTVERAVAIASGDEVTREDIRFSRLEDGTPSPVLEDVYKPISLREIERRHIEATLSYTRWVKRETARILGIERSTLDRKLKSYGLDKPEIL
ncbi:MAG: sigma 54-interacting transcriptional regulator [Planctomycetaceae bacterium]|nr:sigma 54-interacting transcriptional regulator [Planctomycetaceae bacterium]